MLPAVELIIRQSTAKKCKHCNSSMLFLFQGPTTYPQGYHTEIVVSNIPVVINPLCVVWALAFLKLNGFSHLKLSLTTLQHNNHNRTLTTQQNNLLYATDL